MDGEKIVPFKLLYESNKEIKEVLAEFWETMGDENRSQYRNFAAFCGRIICSMDREGADRFIDSEEQKELLLYTRDYDCKVAEQTCRDQGFEMGSEDYFESVGKAMEQLASAGGDSKENL